MSYTLSDVVRAIRTQPGFFIYTKMQQNFLPAIMSLMEHHQILTHLARMCASFWKKYPDVPVVPTPDLLDMSSECPAEDLKETLRFYIRTTETDRLLPREFYLNLFTFLFSRSLPFLEVSDVLSEFSRLESMVDYACGAIESDGSTLAALDVQAGNFQQWLEQWKEEAEQGLSVGGHTFDLLDQMLRGGLEKGTVSMLLASKGEGKTWAAVCSACETVRRGKSVLFVTLENSAKNIVLRALPMMHKVPFTFVDAYSLYRTLSSQKMPLDRKAIEYLFRDAPAFKELFFNLAQQRGLFGMLPGAFQFDAVQSILFECCAQLLPLRPEFGNFHLRHVAAGKLTIRQVQSFIEETSPSHVIIDYLNEVFVPPGIAKHEALATFTRDLRALASQYNCSVLMNAQMRRGFKTAVLQSQYDLSAAYEFAAESFGAIWVADNVFILLQLSKLAYNVGDKIGVNHIPVFQVHINRARETAVGASVYVMITSDGRVLTSRRATFDEVK